MYTAANSFLRISYFEHGLSVGGGGGDIALFYAIFPKKFFPRLAGNFLRAQHAFFFLFSLSPSLYVLAIGNDDDVRDDDFAFTPISVSAQSNS